MTQGTAILHLFPGVAQVKFFWVFFLVFKQKQDHLDQIEAFY
jgi:hypothetical protein